MSVLFSNFSWYELWGPLYLVFCGLLSYWYFKRVVFFHRLTITTTHINCFMSAVVLLYLIKGSPLAVIAKHYLFSAHILQLSVLFFAIIPLFILGLPTSFLRQYFWHYRTRLFMGMLAYPWVNVFLFNGIVTVYLLPPVFNTIQESVLLTLISQVVLMLVAFLMWWVIISPIPEVSHIPYLSRIVYIFFASILLMPIGIFLLIIQKEHYHVYAAVAGDLIPFMTAIYDQQLAGGILKVVQLTSYVFALLKIVLTWGKEEDEKEGQVDDENVRVVQGVVIYLQQGKR